MALQVWLPLTKDTNNYGLSQIGSPTVNGLTANTSGKLGGCYKGYSLYHLSEDIIDNEWTIAAWVKSDSWGQYNDIIFCKNVSASNDCQIYFSIVSGNSLNIGINGPSGSMAYGYTFSTNTWYHIAATYNGSKCAMYINGTKVKEGTDTTAKPTGRLNICVGGRSTNAGGTSVTGMQSYINDLRLYDHALSPREVAEIAKGLVLHYPLNDQYNSSNLIYNGFGDHGNDGWDGATVGTTDLPTGDSTIKATFTGGTSRDYVLVNPNNTFSVSAYLKTNGATSGTTYPSILPYDIDKKFIQTHQCADGFSNTWKTTLSQPLNPGDTVIHATNISNWTTDNNYYYHVAIFGYKDSTGFVYPDMEYTQDTPAFGTKTNKSNLNKTNNTITLNSPFTGASRPAGTVICQSTEGSTYFYPFGGVSLANIQSWTKYSANVDFHTSRLRYCKYIRWFNYSGAKYAGIKITDTTWGSNVVYDTSGFGNNGTANNSPIISSDAPRYNMSLVLDGVNQSVQMPNLSTLVPDGIFTANIWFKKVTDGWGSKAYETIFGGPSGFELEGKNSSTNSPVIRAYNWGGATFEYTLDVWHMLTMVRTTSDTKFYLDGELKLTGSAGSIPSGNYFLGAWSSTTGQNYKGWLSDFRLYETALTADQVKQLYEAPISLSDNGTLFGYEFIEI